LSKVLIYLLDGKWALLLASGIDVDLHIFG